MSDDRVARGRSVRVAADPATDPGAEPVVVADSDGEVEYDEGGDVRVRLPDGVVRPWVGPVRGQAGSVEVELDGWRFVFRVEDAARAELRDRASRGRERTSASGPTEVRTPIPGRVVSVAVAVGDRVEIGQGLLVIEAMKMQNDVPAPRAGVVRRIDVAAGRPVDAGDVLLVIE